VVSPANPVIDIFLEVKTHGLTSQKRGRQCATPRSAPRASRPHPRAQAIIPLADTPSPSFPTAGNQVRARFILTCSQAAAAQTNLQQPEFRLGESKRSRKAMWTHGTISLGQVARSSRGSGPPPGPPVNHYGSPATKVRCSRNAIDTAPHTYTTHFTPSRVKGAALRVPS